MIDFDTYNFLQTTILSEPLGMQIQSLYSWILYLSPDSVARRMLQLHAAWADCLKPDDPFQFLQDYDLPKEIRDEVWMPFLNFVPHPHHQLGFAFIVVRLTCLGKKCYH